MELFTKTPWWVWIVLAYLIYVGIKASKAGYVPLFKTAIIPALFTIWSIASVFMYFGFDLMKLGQWIIAAGLGSLLGWVIGSRTPSKIDKQKKAIHLPGGYFTLILVLIIFGVKYYFGYVFGRYPEKVNDPVYANLYVLCSGVFTGIFLGRFLNFCYKYKKAK